MDTGNHHHRGLSLSGWRQMVWAGLVALILCGCSVPFTPMPSSIVMLTPAFPVINGRCTGVIVDATHVLTAAHCVESARRVITPWGQEARIESHEAWPESDIALLKTDRVLLTDHYAELGNAAINTPAQLYGTCPYYWGHQARTVFYGGLFDSPSPDKAFAMTYGVWYAMPRYGDENKACGGDSGGVVMQDGKVVGIISAIESEYPFWAIGTTIFAIPSQTIEGLLKNASQNQN